MHVHSYISGTHGVNTIPRHKGSGIKCEALGYVDKLRDQHHIPPCNINAS